MSACRETDGMVATYHDPRHGETVEVRCQQCGALVATLRPRFLPGLAELQRQIRVEWQQHVAPAEMDFQI